MMDTKRAKAYEKKHLGPEYVSGFDGCRVPTEEEVKEHYKYVSSGPMTDSQQAMHLQNLNSNLAEDRRKIAHDVKLYKRKKELLEKFEVIFQKTSHHFKNIWDDLEEPGEGKDVNESLKAIWNGLSNERMIGVLHAFVLLKPTLDKCIRNCNKIDGAIKFMVQNGFQAHSNHSIPNMANTAKFIPIITREDANHFLNLEHQTTEVSAQMKGIFQQLEDALEVLGQKMPPLP
jgi:hypothetical protein